MPAAVPVIIAAAQGAIASFSIAGVLTSLATSLVLSGLTSLIFKPKKPSSGSVQSSGITTQVRQPIITRKAVYGEIRVSGGILFMTSTQSNKFLHLVVEVAQHEVDAIGEVWINDFSVPNDMLGADGVVNSGRYNGIVRIKKHLGGLGQVVDPDLLAEVEEITEAHKFSGIAYIYARLEYDQNKFPTGVPNFSAWVKGKKVVDTRDSVQKFSMNSALHLNDYLRSTNFGLGASSSEIDTDFVDAAANTSDEFVTTANVNSTVESIDVSTDLITLIDFDRLPYIRGDKVRLLTTDTAPAGLAVSTDYYVIPYQRRDILRIKLASSFENSMSGTAINITDVGVGTHTISKIGEPRYSAAIQLDSAETPQNNIQFILTSMGGKMVYSGGKFKIHAASYQTPTISFNENHIVSAINLQTKLSRRERFNTVRGTYISPLNDGQPSDFPEITNATYKTEDGGDEVVKQFDLPATQRPHTAQRIAKILLEQSRQELTWSADFNLSAMQLQAGDNALFTVERFGWTDKVFEVQDWVLKTDDEDGVPVPKVRMTLRETASGVHDWNSGEETAIDLAPNTSLPNPFDVGESGAPIIVESLFSSRDGGGVKSRVDLSCTASPDLFVVAYRFRYKLTTDTEYIERSPVKSPQDTIFDIPAGRYDFEVAAINTLGVESDFVVNTPVEIYGLSAPPAALTGLNIQAISSLALLRWDRHVDLDVTEGGSIRFRHSEASTGATWATSVSIGEIIDGGVTETLLPLKEGTYLARPYDSSGIPSDTVTSVITKGAVLLSFANLSTINEHPVFTGTKVDCALNTTPTPDVLFLTGAGLWDDIPDFDAESSIDAFGGLSASGTYDFAAGVDLGSVQTVRLSSKIKAYVVNELDLIDDRTALIDTWESFDGDVTGDGDCQIWVRETDDDPASSPAWSEYQRLDVGEYTARGFDFQARLTTNDIAYNIYVEELSIYVDQ